MKYYQHCARQTIINHVNNSQMSVIHQSESYLPGHVCPYTYSHTEGSRNPRQTSSGSVYSLVWHILRLYRIKSRLGNTHHMTQFAGSTHRKVDHIYGRDSHAYRQGNIHICCSDYWGPQIVLKR